MYAQLCRKISEGAKNFELENKSHGKSELYENTFCKYLLAKCRNEFDNRCQASEAFGDGPLSEQDEERRDQAKKVMLGNIKFICELGKQNLAEEAILHRCIQELLRKKNNTKNFVEDLECLCQIMKTIGKLLDTERSKSLMDQYFNRMEKYATHHELPLRIKFKIQDSLDLRRNKWVPRDVQVDQNPKTLVQIREEATKDYSFLQPGGSLMGNFMPNSFGNNQNQSSNMRGNFNYSGSPYFAASGQRAIDELFGSQFSFTNSFNSNNNNNFENANPSNNSNIYQQQQAVRRTNNQHQNNYLRQNKNNENINSSSSSSNSSFVREDDSNVRNINRDGNNRKENNNYGNRQENFRDNKDLHQNDERQNFSNNHYRNNMNNHENKHVNFNNQNNPNGGNMNMNTNNNRFNNYNNNFNNNYNNNYQNRNNSMERNMNNKMNNLNIRDQNNVSSRNELPPRFQKMQQPPINQNQYPQNRNFNNNNNNSNNQDFVNQQRPNNYNNNNYNNKNNYNNNNYNNNFNPNQQGNQYQRQNYNNYNNNNNNKVNNNSNNSNNSINLHPPSQKLVAQVPNFTAMDSKEISLRPAINFVVSKPNSSGNVVKPENDKNNASIVQNKKNQNDSSISSVKSEEKITEKVVVKDQKERYYETVNEVLLEFLEKKLNEDETLAKIKEQYLVKVSKSCLLAHIMKYALGKSENERELITNFITKLYNDKFCATEDFITAFKEILKSMSDLEVDVPKVKSFVAVYIAKAVRDEIIDLKEAFNLTVKTVYYPLFLLCLQFLGQNQDQTWLTNKFNESKLDLMLALPEIDRNKERLSEVLRDRQLGFLYPLLRIESELMKQVNIGEEISPKSLYTWIKENVDSNLQKTEGFIITLFTCLAKYVTEKTKPLIAEIKEGGSNADKRILEIEKEIMSKYAQIFQSFLLERQDLQLVLLYALQTYCHELGFPKGMIFRWFILLYDLEIVDGEVFLKWKEEVNDNYPDKGKALFQVNNWLIWLEKAEEDEEEEEEDA